MPQNRQHSHFNIKIIIALVMVLAFLLGLVQLAQGLIDTKGFQDRMMTVVKEQTGLDMLIKGNVTLSLLPKPTFYVPDVELSGFAGDNPLPGVSADMIEVDVSPFSIFSANPRVTSITLDHPTLGIERAADGDIHWAWLNETLLKSFAGGAGDALSVAINNGKIVYQDTVTQKGMAIINVHARATSGKTPRMNGSFTVEGHDLNFKIETEASDKDDKPLHLSLYSDDKNKASLEGTFNLAGEMPRISGALTVDADDIQAWLLPKTGGSTGFMDRLSKNAKADEKSLLPVKLSADLTETGWDATLDHVKFEGVNSAGGGKIGMSWQSVPSIDMDMEFSAIDANRWKMLADSVQAKTQLAAGAAADASQYDSSNDNPLPKNVKLNVNFFAHQLFAGAQTWENAAVRANFYDGAITVNEFHIGLPGDSSLSMFGIVSQGTPRGLRFEGIMETQGKKLKDFLTIFDQSAAGLPEDAFGDFYIRSNIFISSEQLRLSEADVKINDLRLNGGLVAYYDGAPRLEADVKLKNINFDYFRDLARKKQQQPAAGAADAAKPDAAAAPAKPDAAKKQGFLAFDKAINLDWLKNLQTTIDLKVNVNHFTFLDHDGSNASFRLFARDGEFGIYDVRFYYPRDTMEASFKLSLKDGQPYMNLLLNTNQLDTNYFDVTAPDANAAADSAAPAAAPAPAPADASGEKRWSEDLIDMGWMDGINGTFDVSIGKVLYHDKSFDNFKMKAALDKNVLTFQSLSFLYWQGKCDVVGSLYGGKVPGISVGFTVYNAEIHDILKSLTDRENLTGRVSASGTLATSGVNMLSWVSQSDAKLAVTARGVNVDGFNLQGAVDAVEVSRTASDVYNNVNRALRDGSTEMSVDGSVNVKNGSVRSPGITLKAGTIVGNLNGEIKLVPWTMELNTLYQFPAMPSETIPTMTVQLSGSNDKPDIQVDTSSLEAYVAKRITGR